MFVLIVGIVTALAAAARSTWSPCGLSMLSQITPIAEAGRGQKFGRTASWFIAGATLGGLALGGAIGAAAVALGAAGIHHTAAVALIIAGALTAAAVDTHVLGFGPPFLPRQVNADWLSTYRPWVYAGGFGLQIGAGVTTYVMTAAVGCMIAIGALSANPYTALGIGVVFGLARGLAVLLGANIRTPELLYSFHRRFDAWSEPVRRVTIGSQLAIAVAAAWSVGSPVVATGVTIVTAALAVRARSAGFGVDDIDHAPFVEVRATLGP